MLKTLKQWYTQLKRIADNRRILLLMLPFVILLDSLLHWVVYKLIFSDPNQFELFIVRGFLNPILNLLHIATVVMIFLILSSLFKRSRLYSALQWFLITVLLMVISILTHEHTYLFMGGLRFDALFIQTVFYSLLDFGRSKVGSYFDYSGGFLGAFDYFTSSYRLVPLLIYALPFVRFVLTFRNQKPGSDKVKKPVGAILLSLLANTICYAGGFGFILFILVIPAADTIEGYQPYFILIYLFLAALFIPVTVLGTVILHYLKPKTTEKFRFNLNVINGTLNIMAALGILILALTFFLGKIIGTAVYDAHTATQIGWIAFVFSMPLAANAFRILLQNKPLWMIQQEEEAKLQASVLAAQQDPDEHRSPVGVVIPFEGSKAEE